MAATSKLIVFNEALRELGSHPLANTTSANTRLQELNGAFDHAVEYMLSRLDWNFARRRATLTGTSDTSFAPFTFRYARPSDYLRKVWIKRAANDEFQIDHAESGAVVYGFETSALMEYMSDTAANYEPANWPPQFSRCLVIYLAMLVGPKIARVGDDDAAALYQKLDMALAEAERQEAVYTVNAQVATNRLPTIRRAIEIMGQAVAGTVAINSRLDELRWSMNKAWDDAVLYVLTQGAWNFAAKRAVFLSGESGDTNIPTDSIAGIIEGYSVAPPGPSEVIGISGYDYSYEMPADFVHKIWIKANVGHYYECSHQQLGSYMFTQNDPCVMEYVAADANTTNPANWPHLFRETVAAYLALVAAPELVIEEKGKGGGRVTNAGLRDKLEVNFMRKLSDAKIKDAIQQDIHRIPPGRFAQARMGSIGTRR